MTLKKGIALSLVLILLISMIGCSGKAQAGELVENNQEIEENEKESDDTIEEDEENGLEKEVKEIDLEAIRPNEAGEIMVLMYHHIKEPEAEWSRTPDNFRKDLQVLYDNGYRPISLFDYVTGNITTEAGFTPVVFTFDDGNQNNFNMIQNSDGEWIIDPDSAVGILVDFNEKNPDFPLEATFFINGGTPFGQKEFVEYKLKYLVEKGMDIGNHTNTHINFTNAGKDKIQEELGKLAKLVNSYLPDYQVNTLALPFGSKPKDTGLFQYVIEGEWEGKPYQHRAILEVGWDPYLSPYHQSFNPSKIRRVRASETNVAGVGMYDWLEAFNKGSRIRYISDGDPVKVTVPEKYLERLLETIEGREIRSYTFTN